MHCKMSYVLGLTAAVLFAPLATAQETSGLQKQKTIVETAAGEEAFSTLVAALKAADLVEALSGKGPFTVFAPTNEAFEALPKGTIENLLKPENKTKLQAVLKHHVIAGRVLAADVAKLDSAKTLQGQTVSVEGSSAGVMIEDAKVTKTDIVCSNGVVHAIDKVILPE